MSDEVLVVVSKLKNYIKSTSGLSTAGSVPAVLSKAVKELCDEAVENAKNDGRKTVMDRDFRCDKPSSCSM
jgi:histone H3/H4